VIGRDAFDNPFNMDRSRLIDLI